MWLRPRGNPGYLIRDYRMKMTGMPVLSLRGRNYKFWSHLFRTARSEREYSTPRCRSQKRSPFNKHYTWLHICYSPVHMVVLLTNTVYWKLKNPLDVSPCWISWQNSSSFSTCTMPFLEYCPFHEGTNHSGWKKSNRCTTMRLYQGRHNFFRGCHYHDLWW